MSLPSNHSRRFSVLFPLAGLLFLSVFLFHPSAAVWAADAPLPVIVSIAPQKYMLERIAGDRVAVAVLVKPGADPHSYEPSPAQMRACASARAWFTIGVPFEDAWLPRIRSAAPNLAVISTIARIKRLSFADDALLLADQELARKARESAEAASSPGKAASSGADAPPVATPDPSRPAATQVEADDRRAAGLAEHGEHHDHEDHGHGAEDPHVWLSPMLVRDMLSDMARELGKLMPEYAGEFRANAKAFAAELEELDSRLAERFSEFPREKRVFLTFHPSWRYFAHNYELTELAIEVEGKEPGPQSMKTIIDAAKAYGIRTIFIEPQFPKTAAQAIADNIGAKVAVADPLAENLSALYEDMANKLIESFKQ